MEAKPIKTYHIRIDDETNKLETEIKDKLGHDLGPTQVYRRAMKALHESIYQTN